MFGALGGLSQPREGSKVGAVIGLRSSSFGFWEASLGKQGHGVQSGKSAFSSSYECLICLI